VVEIQKTLVSVLLKSPFVSYFLPVHHPVLVVQDVFSGLI